MGKNRYGGCPTKGRKRLKSPTVGARCTVPLFNLSNANKNAMLTEDYNKLMYLTGADIIFLFGSVLSDNLREESDIDIGIYFEGRR